MGALRFVVLVAALLGCACPERAPALRDVPHAEPAFGNSASLALDKAELRSAGAAPSLLAKLDASVYRYFRALSVEYSSRVCFEFQDLRWHLPVVAVHGDAHVGQFVVTETTFGLEDYDQAGFGPAVVDLVRFAASLHLACREVKWSCQADQAVVAFFREYRAALAAPPVRVAPALVDRVRRRVASSRAAWLTWADSLSHSLPDPLEQAVRRRWASFAAKQHSIFPERPVEFYDVIRLGSLQLGVGSALETKYLFRVRGASDAPLDDVILEARATRSPRFDTGIWSPHHGGSLHTLYFMFLLGPRLPEVFGTAILSDDPQTPEFWLQSWEPGYAELSISDLESQADLEELAVDAARQLAGHFWVRFPEPLRPVQRIGQLQAFDMTELRARSLAKELAGETFASWQRFRRTR